MSDDTHIAAEQWIAAFAASLGVDPPDAGTADALLALAGVAAHASERPAAPIAAYLVGRAGIDATTALERAEEISP